MVRGTILSTTKLIINMKIITNQNINNVNKKDNIGKNILK